MARLKATGNRSDDLLEHDIEQYLFDRCREHGFLALKFTSPARAGVPDRVIVCPGRTLFVEVKRPGERPRRLQQEVFARMRAAGGEVHVVDTFSTVDDLMAQLTGTGRQIRTDTEGR